MLASGHGRAAVRPLQMPGVPQEKMNRLLFPSLVLVLLSDGCRCAADSEKPAGRVQLEIFPKTLTKDEMAFDYQITNGLRGAIYFICPDPACSDNPRWPNLPFYELNESSVLAVYSYRARYPRVDTGDLHRFVRMKLEPGTSYRGHVSLKAPYEVSRPYPTGEYKPEIIWSPMIDTFQLTIGYFTCPGVEAEPDLPPAEAERILNPVDGTSDYLSGCGTEPWIVVPQHLVRAEGGILHDGDWPDSPLVNAMRKLMSEMDAGR